MLQSMLPDACGSDSSTWMRETIVILKMIQSETWTYSEIKTIFATSLLPGKQWQLIQQIKMSFQHFRHLDIRD